MVSRILTGRDSLEDDPRPGRPADVISQEMIDRVERLVLNNHQIKVAELASESGISNGSVYTIVHEHLGMSKVSARWVPRNLNMQDRQQRVESSRELLEVYNANPEDFHTRLVTGDETWLHHWDPDTKKESMQWKRPGSSTPKEFRTQLSASKVMATVFWDSKGIILIDYKPAGTSITGEYYANVIKQLRVAIKEKRRGKLAAGVLLLHDNSPVHKSRVESLSSLITCHTIQTWSQVIIIFFRSQLIWLYTVCKGRVYPGSAGKR